MPDHPSLTRHRPLALLGALILAAVAAACSTDAGDAEGTWTLGPTLAPASGDPGTGEPAGSAAPSGSVPVGSGAPVASVGPDTSSAPQPSAAP